LLASVSAAGCVPRSPPPIVGAPCNHPSTSEEVFVGLYSIYYRAAQVPSRGEHLGWPPAPLVTAARYLQCDRDEGRKRYRVRYAAIKLATGLVKLQRYFPHDRRAIDEFKGALAQLRIPDELAEDLAKSPPETPSGGLEDKAGGIIDSKPSSDPLAALQRTCCPCLKYCRSGTADGGVAVVEFTIHVDRGAQCLGHVIDPQCWKKVVPINFNTDPQVLNGPQCSPSTPPEPRCRDNQTCHDPVLPALQPVNMPPLPATPWCGLLSEDPVVAASGITANAQNVLGVRTTKTLYEAYRTDYKLCEAREWSVAPPNASGNCAPDLDCGYASVGDTDATGTNADLSGTKRLRFMSTFPNNANGWAPTALEVLATETATATCVASAECPGAKLPASCSGTMQGSTTDTEPCQCDKSIDHCDGPYDTFNPTFEAPLCPKLVGGEP